MLPVPDEIFERKYRIDRVLGKGAFSHVYRAIVDEIEREVAIKVLKPKQGVDGPYYDPSLEKRFLREARTLSDLQDPHTIRLYDFGRSENGLLFLIFEFVDGVPLNQAIPGNGPFEPRRATYVVQQLLESLREAHLHKIIHRDIKPANIMLYEYLGDPNRIKLLDFGIAKEANDSTHLTTKGKRIGTVRYMSPEQIRGDELTPASDIYSLGLVFYELLTGFQAVREGDLASIIQFHLRPSGIELPPRMLLPPDLRDLVHSMMLKDDEKRPASGEHALRALRRIDWDVTEDAYSFADDKSATVTNMPIKK